VENPKIPKHSTTSQKQVATKRRRNQSCNRATNIFQLGQNPLFFAVCVGECVCGSQVIRFISSCTEKCTPNTEMELEIKMEMETLTATVAKVSQSEICGSVLRERLGGKCSMKTPTKKKSGSCCWR